MIDILKILLIPFVTAFGNRTTKIKFMSSINSKWHLNLVKYNFDSILYITQPLHDDAYKELVKNIKNQLIDMHEVYKRVFVLNDDLVDCIINHPDLKYIRYYNYHHIMFLGHIISKQKQYELVAKYHHGVNLIHDTVKDIDIMEHHKFIHEL